ncbi:MAG: hypothetical protein ACRDZY_20695 [Acidimicrobiales bacterium]
MTSRIPTDPDDLRALPTLAQGQADNLKYDDGSNRVWLSRLGIVDGMPSENTVTVEHLINGCWVTVRTIES